MTCQLCRMIPAPSADAELPTSYSYGYCDMVFDVARTKADAHS